MRAHRSGRIGQVSERALSWPHIGRQEPGPRRCDDRMKLAARTELRQDVLDVAAGGMQALDELVCP